MRLFQYLLCTLFPAPQNSGNEERPRTKSARAVARVRGEAASPNRADLGPPPDAPTLEARLRAAAPGDPSPQVRLFCCCFFSCCCCFFVFLFSYLGALHGSDRFGAVPPSSKLVQPVRDGYRGHRLTIVTVTNIILVCVCMCVWAGNVGGWVGTIVGNNRR